MTVYKAIKVGKPLKLDDLKRKPAPRGRQPSPRDVELAKLVNEVSVGPASDVIPWQYDGKRATARAAANKVIKGQGRPSTSAADRTIQGYCSSVGFR